MSTPVEEAPVSDPPAEEANASAPAEANASAPAEANASAPAEANASAPGHGAASGPTVGSARARRRRIRRRRRLLAAVSLLGPTIWIVSLDVARRASHIAGFDRTHLLGYLLSILASACLWGSLLYAAAGRRGPIRQLVAGVFAALFAFSVGVQSGFYALYRVYLSYDCTIDERSIVRSIEGELPFSRPLVAFHLAVTLAFTLAFLIVARRRVRPRRRPRRLSPVFAGVMLVVAFTMPVSYYSLQSTSPELIYFHAIHHIVTERLRQVVLRGEPRLVRGQRRTPERVPALTAAPARPRNVLLILQESQRADVTCTEYIPHCNLATPESNQAVPGRIPFLQLRANTSSTAIAMVTLWSGIDPTSSNERIHSAPLIWEYARAAGWDTAYWTSQNLTFGNARLYVQDIPASHFVSGTELSRDCEIVAGARDELAVDRAIDDWGSLKEPFVAVVHLANIHRPRVVDRDRLLFQPSNIADKGTGGTVGKNHYKNAVYLSDLAVTKLIRHVRGTESGKRTVIMYTSDHGESYREHRNENDHAGSVYDEEIRVPAWIDAPPGTISPEEEQNLRRARSTLLFQLDLSATLFDLLGLWDEPRFQPFRARMLGQPLTRASRKEVPMPLTNVSWAWEYQYANYGLMLGPLKAIGTAGEAGYRCFNIIADPAEKTNLGEASCGELLAATRAFYGVAPRDLHRLARHPEWAPK